MGKEYHVGMTQLLNDIKKNSISKTEVSNIADELLKKGIIPESIDFDKKKRSEWDQNYVDFLMHGMSTGRISKEYLEFYSDVSAAVKAKRKKRNAAIGIICGIAAITALIVIIVKILKFR